MWIIITLAFAIFGMLLTQAISVSQEKDIYKEKLFDIFNFLMSISDPLRKSVCEQIDQHLTYLSNTKVLLRKYLKKMKQINLSLLSQC